LFNCLLARLFETHPDVQEVFTPFRGLPMEEVQQSKELRSHALRVMGFVEKAVRRLDQPEKLVPLIQECGRNHCHYGAQVQHIELVGPQFLQAIKPALEDQWTEEVEVAWGLLMMNIAYVMKTAMKKEMMK
ncbi:leghemoglobin 49-like, partial [Homarus americanus]|uniref:leghemoglobin 49-like n=1 Tax=Homarus americanus TaxID=6706 RepID=UPI001C48EB81